MKKKPIVTALAIILLVAVPIGIIVVQNSIIETNNLFRVCPDQWYEDRMPGTDSNRSPSQYLIVSGERKEAKYYDLSWIKDNCSVNKPGVVY